jgi:hypothetical protein
MGILKWNCFIVIGFIMSCANLPENSINKDIGILNIDSILNEEVSYIDNNVLNIEKKILINNILDTVAILSAKGSMILNVLLEIKYPQLYIKDERKTGYKLVFKDKSKPLKSIVYNKGSDIKFFLEHSNLLYSTLKEYKLIINKGLYVKGWSKTFWGDKDYYDIQIDYK